MQRLLIRSLLRPLASRGELLALVDVLGDLVPERIRGDALLRHGRLGLVLVLHGHGDAEARAQPLPSRCCLPVVARGLLLLGSA